MVSQVLELKCPSCGAPITQDQKSCDWCHNPLVITSFNEVSFLAFPELEKRRRGYERNLAIQPDNSDIHMSLAFCYFKLKLFDEAYNAFSKVIENDPGFSDAYFYSAVCMLKGKKAFLSNRAEIDRILQLMNAAVSIEPKGIYYYFMSYVKYDYFKRKFLNTTPNYKEYLALATKYGCSSFDIDTIFDMIGIDRIQII